MLINRPGKLISERKVNVDCSDLESAQKLFECLKFEKLVEVKYHVIVLEKDGMCKVSVEGIDSAYLIFPKSKIELIELIDF